MFNRINAEEFIAEMIAAHQAPAEKAPSEPVAPFAEEITIDTFAKADIRVAEVLECEKVKKSSKLLCFRLFDGIGKRQVVSGIAKWYKPEDLVGKKVIIVANLAPATLCGVESQGMILAADTPDGGAAVVFPDQSLPCGSKIR
jgi:methionyl-tRNA synthetase